ncbi:MAG: nitrogen fixation protein NifU [Parcubacteria group bacterium Gr01-1014_13]|nr:MAG: nitrogen fixation protein NifU [Parcubacteria group bacterium Gr01-1014_13]
MDIYSETILDHYQHPHHAGSISNPTIKVTEDNPLCGDKISLELTIKNGVVEDLGFVGTGCAISQAAMSLLADEIGGKKISSLKKLKAAKVYDLLHVPISPGRVKCALLGLSTLKKALNLYDKKS